jgi:hypothetical protein
MTLQKALQTISARLEQYEPGQSSHWKLMMASPSWNSASPGPRHGLGVFIPWTWRRGIIHYLMQAPFRRYGRDMRAFPATLAAARRIAKAHGRVLDLDDLRQTLSLSCVREHFDLSAPSGLTIAIIGDGYARLSSLILDTLPRCRVVLVNLTRALYVDLMSLQRLWPDLEVQVMDGSQAAADARVTVIPAHAAEALTTIRVDGAFNVSSMQEMNPETVAQYFALLRGNPSPATWFYCANATSKRLPDGTISSFHDYPWDPRDEILLDGLVPWSQMNYQIRPPRYFPRLYDIRHRLARLYKPR